MKKSLLLRIFMVQVLFYTSCFASPAIKEIEQFKRKGLEVYKAPFGLTIICTKKTIVTDEEWKRALTIPGITSFAFGYSCPANEHRVRMVGEIKTLQKLYFVKISNFKDEWLLYIVNPENLIEFEIVDSPVTTKAYAMIGKFKNLKNLHLWSDRLTSDNFEYLVGLSKLEELEVGSKLDSRAVPSIINMKKLRSLSVVETGLSSNDIYIIEKERRKLYPKQEFEIDYSNRLGTSSREGEY